MHFISGDIKSNGRLIIGHVISAAACVRSGGAGNGKKQYPWLKNNRPNLWIAFCRQRTEREGESSVGVEFSWCANNLCGILMLPLAEKPEY
jgi:hypothetical protein